MTEMQWKAKIPMPTESVKKALTLKYNYEIDESTLSNQPELQKISHDLRPD